MKRYSAAEKLRRAENLSKGKYDLEVLVSYDYKVEQFSEYHFRINNRLDVWPTSKKYYDQRTMRKGEYDGLEKFVRQFLPMG